MSTGTDGDGPDRPICLVTGAAGDIGGAVASRLAADYQLALVDHASRADDLAVRGRELGAWTTTFDVTSPDEVSAAVDRLVDEVGAPTALFNNAGVQGAFTPIDRYPLDDAAQVLNVNVLGAFNVLSIVSRAMVHADRGGAIVNSASMAGVSGAPNMSAYSASKAAIIGLTKSAAKDLAPANIRVNAVSPAFIGPGDMWERQVRLQADAGSQYFSTDPIEVAAQMIGSVPLRRYGTLDEVAGVVAFLLSDAAAYVNATNTEISGGST